MSRTISRARCEEQMDGKARPLSTLSRLNFYQELYQANLSCMLSGLPYSQHVMDSALNAIMSIAIEDETHQRFGEFPKPIREAIEEEQESDAEWLGIDTHAAIAYGDNLTPEQINLDLWQKETEATRKTDYPF
jgi:hypothetical protein